jgi:hypothetical protein
MNKFQFDFSEQYGKNIELSLSNNYRMYVTRDGCSNARLYCVDKDKQMIIPEGFIIVNNTCNEYVYPFEKLFILCWTDNYTITFDQIRISILSMRMWNITTNIKNTNVVLQEPLNYNKNPKLYNNYINDYPGSECDNL